MVINSEALGTSVWTTCPGLQPARWWPEVEPILLISSAVTAAQEQEHGSPQHSEDNNRQVTTSIKRCHTSRQWHQEVWPGTVTTDASAVTLAGHSRASEVQVGHAYPPVSARQGASVLIKLLHSSRPSRYTTASTLHCTSSADRTSTSSQHDRVAGICYRWSNDVQCCARWLRDPAVSITSFRQPMKNTFSLPISTFSALRFHVMHYINVHRVS